MFPRRPLHDAWTQRFVEVLKSILTEVIVFMAMVQSKLAMKGFLQRCITDVLFCVKTDWY